MAYKEMTPYRRGVRPQLAESDREYIDRELSKIETTLRTVLEAIVELRTRKRDV